MDATDVDLDALEQKIKELSATVAKLSHENKQLKQALKQSDEKLNAALDGTDLCLWEQDIPTGNLTIFNQEWGDLLGYTLDERPAHIESWKSHLHPEDKEWVIKAFYDHVEGIEPVYRAVHRMIHKDGSTRWISDRGRIIEFTACGKPKRIIGTHTDITQEKRYELELSKLAHFDPLTNLLNRNAIINKYKQHFQGSGCGGSLLFIDLDGFKGVNDKAGHKVGDALLIFVANTIKSQLKTVLPQAHNFTARVGGDEFIILTAASDKAALSVLSQSLLRAFDHPFVIESYQAKIGLSIGIHQFTQPLAFATLYEQADKAMYAVKQQGKHGVKFYEGSL